MENITVILHFHRNNIKKNGDSEAIDRNFIYRKKSAKYGAFMVKIPQCLSCPNKR